MLNAESNHDGAHILVEHGLCVGEVCVERGNKVFMENPASVQSVLNVESNHHGVVCVEREIESQRFASVWSVLNVGTKCSRKTRRWCNQC